MHDAPARDDEIVRTARIDEGADADRNDRRTRVIWAAGFIDGEGSISVASNRRSAVSKNLMLFLTVSQVNPAPLAILADLFGGTVRGPYLGKGSRKPHFAWAVAARRAAAALRELEPYLVVKQGEARLGLEFQTVVLGKARHTLTAWDVAERDSYRLALMDAHAFTWG